MRAVNIMTDKAIEFEATFRETNRMVDNLKSIDISGIDTLHIQKAAIQIRSDCERELQDKVSSSYIEEVGIRALAEQVYAAGIAKLLELQSDLRNYDGYFKAYYTIKSMRSEIDKTDFDEPEQIKKFAAATIFLLDDVNHSGTRFYDTEKGIVEELYAFAYFLLKKEMFLFRSSTILTWVRENTIASNFINDEVKKDIEKLKKDADKKRKIEALIANSLKDGISSTYLSDELMYFVSLYNDVSMNKIKNKLESLYQRIEELKGKKENGEAKLEELKERKIGARQKVLVNEFFKNAAVALTTTAAVVGVFVGAFKFANRNADKTIYKTYKDIYSASSEVQTPNAPEYMDLIEEGQDTVLLEYEPWEKHYGRYSYYYSRDIYKYNVSEIALPAYEDYLDIDYKTLCQREYFKTDKVEFDLDLDTLYKEAILEVVHYTQDINDFDKPNPTYFWIPLTVALILNILILFVSYLITYDEKSNASWLWGRLYNLKKSFLEWIKDCKYDREIGLDIKRQLEELRRIMQEDQKCKQLFTDFLGTYEQILPNTTDKGKYLTLARIIKEKQK